MLAAVTPPVQGVQLSVMQFLEHPDASIVREHGQGAHGFLCLSGYPVLASNRDPTMYEFGTRTCTEKEVHVSIHSGGHMVGPERYMETVAALRPDMYVTLCDEVTADAKPKRAATAVRRNTAWLDACLRLHDHYRHTARPPAPPPGEGAGAAGQPQRVQGQGRSKGQQQGRGQHGAASAHAAGGRQAGPGPGATQIEMERPQPQDQNPSEQEGTQQAGRAAQRQDAGPDAAAGAVSGSQEGGSGGVTGGGEGEGPLEGSIVLAALAGGAVAAERARAAAAVGDKEGVGGYALCGLGTGEAPELRPALIAASLDGLPVGALERRPVFASGLVASPEELLDAVAAGVDLLDCAYVAQVTAGGYALTFPLRPPPDWQPLQGENAEASAAGGRQVAGPGPDVSSGADDTKVNLWSTSFRLDKGPLLPGCSCFACRRHSRAYVHHLLNTHEMLADVLLEAHNTSHLLAFCQAIRESIHEGRFEAFRSWFRSLRSAPLVPAPRRTTTKRRATDEAGAGAGEEEEAAVVVAAAAAEGAGDGGAEGRGHRVEGQAKWVRV